MNAPVNPVDYLACGLGRIRTHSLRNFDLTAYNPNFYPLDWNIWASYLCESSFDAPALSEPIDVWAKRWANHIAEQLGVVKVSDTHPLLKQAVLNLNDRHSCFIAPSSFFQGRSAQPVALPYAEVLGDQTGRLVLPRYGQPINHWPTYISASYASLSLLQKAGVTKWIVDLRDNGGGSLPPMVASIAPLVGDRILMYYYEPCVETSTTQSNPFMPIRFNDAGFFMGDWCLPKANVAIPHIPSSQPVALLTSHETASAAEAVCIAFKQRPNIRFFGQETAGVPTLVSDGLDGVLGDGARLFIANGLMADKKKNCYAGPLSPDFRCDPSHAVKRAKDWLASYKAD